MPIPAALIPPIIAGGASLASSGLSAITAHNQQRKANAFNLDMWNRTNYFNSPANQMKRLQQAGLNPNLIYGSGSANTGQASPAPQFEQLSEHGYRPVDISSALAPLQAFADWKLKGAQQNKLESARDLDNANINLRAIEAAGKVMDNTKSAINLKYADQMAQTSLEALQANVEKTKIDTKFTTDQNVRNEVLLRQNVMESAQRILASKSGIELNNAQIRKVMADARVQEFFAGLADAGINPHLRPEITELGAAFASLLKRIFGNDPESFMPEVSGNQKKQLNQPYFPRK